jgi:hypothetical protein
MAMTVPAESQYKIAKARLAEMKGERESWDAHYRELQDAFMTRRGRWITDSTSTRGNKRNQKMIDPKGRFAARTLGAGIHSGSTNPATPWLKFVTPDPEMMEFPSVSRWLYAVENEMRGVFERSNLYSVLPSLYTESGVIGTAPTMALEHATRVVHFVPKTFGSYYLATNADGDIDTMYCEYRMTVRQMVEEYVQSVGWDWSKVSDTVKNEWENGKRHIQHEVLHVIEPNMGRRWDAWDNQNMPFSSIYFETGRREDQQPLRKSGFEDNALACFRWETTEITDPYGSSCGMDALGMIKALQLQTKRKAQAIDKLVDPPMVGDPAMEQKPSSLLPGDVTWSGFTATGNAPRFQPAYVIEEAMYTDLFLAITRADPRNATVPEIAERREEKILSLGPVLQNHKNGLIKPIVDRTFNIMARRGMLPPPPPELEGVDLKIEMMGLLDQAFRAIAGTKIERFTGFVGSVAKAQADAGQEVTAFDKWDTDQTIDEYAQAIGVPPTVVRGDEVVAQIRAARAEQQKAQQAMAAAQPMKDAAQAAQTLSETDVNGEPALDQVVNA